MKLSKGIMVAVVLTLAVAVLAEEAFAGSGRRRGTAGAQELLIPVGGGMGLSGAFTGYVRGAEAIYWNPAGLSMMTGSAEVLFSHMNYLADISFEYVAAGAKLSENSTLGISVQTLDFGDIAVTTVDQPDGTGETYSPTFLTFGITYSRMMTDKIAFGATGKLVTEQILRQNAAGLAFDFGLQYHSAVSGLSFGVTLKNLGPNMQFDGPDLESKLPLPGTEPGSQPRALRTVSQEFDLPSTLEFGVAYSASLQENLSARLSSAFEHQNFSYDNVRLGVEVGYQNMIFLRGGYLISPDAPEEEQLYTYSVGGGGHFKLAENLNIGFDYAYRAAKFFGDNQVFAVKLGF